jgi:hypothetical protein
MSGGRDLEAEDLQSRQRTGPLQGRTGHTCDSCPLKPQCTDNKTGRQVLRHRDERYVDRVKGYRGTFPYEKALRKRRVWVEPLFAEAKEWHGLCAGSGCADRRR